MATKLTKMNATSVQHSAGIFADMTVDGPVIGTLVAIIDRAKNLPNRRSMGKQDPYCAARLGKEAKKTTTDKRGGQTPKWDQELRFTVHDSPDYHQLKVSVFNDDKKTELIGETWASLESILVPGGGQSDTWHGLTCKGKYAGEIRIELTYYDTRPKAEKAPAEKKAESGRVEGQAAALGGPRENKTSTPVKRRPLPSDPTGASPSPVSTPDQRVGLQSVQAGPRGYGTPPRQQQRVNEPASTQRRSTHPDAQPLRRPLPEAASPINAAPTSNHHTPQHQQRPSRPSELELYNTSPIPPPQSTNALQYNDDGFDMSYTTPKPYEVQPIAPLPPPSHEFNNRTLSQIDFRSSQGHSQVRSIELPHSYSAPNVPTHHSYEPEPPRLDPYAPQHSDDNYDQSLDLYQEPSYHVEPLRMSRNGNRGQEQVSPHDPYQADGYMEPQSPYDHYDSHGRRASAMQPTVEDEDDIPPPPPMHRSNASTISQHHEPPPPNYHGDSPAPLNFARYRDEPAQIGYDSPPQPYDAHEYSIPQASERRYTHPRASPQPTSRPVSRDTMAPSPFRQETSLIPASLIAGYQPSRQDNRLSLRADNRDSNGYEISSSYETPLRLRQNSEPEYRASPHYDTPLQVHPLAHYQSITPAESPEYYPHAPPQEPRHTSPVQDSAPLIKPRAVSPGIGPANANSPVNGRSSRGPTRSMPTRKSVSPRPPPSTSNTSEQRFSAFAPDSFDVLNPTVSRSPKPGANGGGEDERPGSSMEFNDKGQIVTFSGRVIDASDHLPVDSWAPEPERKGEQKDRPRRERAGLNGARDLEAAKEREEKYRRERIERERIRNAASASFGSTGSPSNALVTSRHYSSNNSPVNAGAMVLASQDPYDSGGRNRLQKRNNRPDYSITLSNSSSNVLRERENVGGYGSSPAYDRSYRQSVAAPPIPAKIPIDAGYGHQSEDMHALSLELQSIDIGPGSAGRNRGTTRRRYG